MKSEHLKLVDSPVEKLEKRLPWLHTLLNRNQLGVWTLLKITSLVLWKSYAVKTCAIYVKTQLMKSLQT